MTNLWCKNKKNSFFHKSKIFDLCKTYLPSFGNSPCINTALFNGLFYNGDNTHFLYPSDSSIVSTILNRSELADNILKQNKNSTANNSVIQQMEVFDFYINHLLLNVEKPEHQLKVLTQLLDNQNISMIIEYGFLGVLSSFLQKDSSKTQALHIIHQLMMFDMNNNSKHLKTLESLKKLSNDENIYVILSYLFSCLHSSPQLQSENQSVFLKSLNILLQSLDELIGFNLEIYIQILLMINIIANKNSP